jgi:hypothetical protein
MAGLFDLLGQQQGGGLFGGFGAPQDAGLLSGLANNQNAILGYLAGALQGGSLGESIARGLQGWQSGAQADTQAANQRQSQRAARDYVAGAQDLDPALRSSLMASPVLAAQYLTQRLKPTDAPSGFLRTATGGLMPIPGGPADPAYLRDVYALRRPHVVQQIEQRRLLAEAIGLEAGAPATQRFIITGRLPENVRLPAGGDNPP